MKMTWWNVYLNGKLIDNVPYDSDVDADYVRRGLIGHDGYDSGIVVKKQRKPRKAKAARIAGGKKRHGRTARASARKATRLKLGKGVSYNRERGWFEASQSGGESTLKIVRELNALLR